MEKLVLKKLPKPVVGLVEEIESAMGKEITYLPNPYPICLTDPNPNALACSVSEHGADIFHRVEEIDPHGLTHELLHIRRYLVENIPQILPVKDPTGQHIQITSQIENSLEHLIIVPMEEQFGFEPYEYWHRTSLHNWTNFDRKIMNKFAIKKNCILGWLTTSNLVKSEEVRELAYRKIKKSGLLNEARKINKEIVQSNADKCKQLRILVRCLQIPANAVKIITYYPAENRVTEAVL